MRWKSNTNSIFWHKNLLKKQILDVKMLKPDLKTQKLDLKPKKLDLPGFLGSGGDWNSAQNKSLRSYEGFFWTKLQKLKVLITPAKTPDKSKNCCKKWKSWHFHAKTHDISPKIQDISPKTQWKSPKNPRILPKTQPTGTRRASRVPKWWTKKTIVDFSN